MSESGSKSNYDRMLAISAVILPLVTGIGVGVALYIAQQQNQGTLRTAQQQNQVTLRTAQQQNSAAETQNQDTHAVNFAEIYFSAPMISAQENIDNLLVKSYQKVKASTDWTDWNGAVANLIPRNSTEEHYFDRLIKLYDAISACANRQACSEPVVQSLYGSEIKWRYKNWYGYVKKRRKELANYGCATEIFLSLENTDADCSK